MKCWYFFNTIKGSMAILLEGNTLYQLILPPVCFNMESLAGKSENIVMIQVAEEDDTIEVINKIRSYYKGQSIHDWGVKPDISTLPPFYRRSLECVYTIPYGKTMTYGEVARAIGSPRAARAVGQANRNNPIPLVIPCHRVVGVKGLGGFSGAGGVQSKLEMLQLEKVNFNKMQ